MILSTPFFAQLNAQCNFDDAGSRSSCGWFCGSEPFLNCNTSSATNSHNLGPVTASHTGIKTIRIMIHVVQDANGLHNFNSTHESLLNDILDDVEDIIREIQP